MCEPPTVLIDSKGVAVLYKPPGWEVDVTAGGTCDGLNLSTFMQKRLPAAQFPLVHLPDFGFGFIHRLDVPSSGLVLVATTFEGLYGLQWQKNIYEINREYMVIGHNLAPANLEVVDVRVNVTGSKISRTLAEDQGRPAVTHLLVSNHFACPMAWEGARYCLMVLRIYTGRRHQIRAHTRWAGSPTAADGWYVPRELLIHGVDQTGPPPIRRWVKTPRWVD
eukprot:gnl/MRDRNA2_/MRDRNA2_74067_c0_seq1.p2 gnl/MRDRNA2_/MRDRNA2_74067_c0~~gnl/MRDRNA2_/MRDRNA2_74067_c0_seq1.p2  ORF type:complete len:221 (+),score=21.52 gnl/MRDRNA2_/MRDRNA2_74067_c0_seq1:394-1056(+)